MRKAVVTAILLLFAAQASAAPSFTFRVFTPGVTAPPAQPAATGSLQVVGTSDLGSVIVKGVVATSVTLTAAQADVSV